MLRRWLALGVALVLLAACGAAAPGETPAGKAGTSETTPSAGNDQAGSDIVAIWTRTGGIAGLHEEMTVHADGTLILDRGGKTQTGQVAPEFLRQLKELVASAAWQNIEPSYGRQSPDAFAYTVEAGGKSVQTYDGAQPPEPLAYVLQLLNMMSQMASAGAHVRVSVSASVDGSGIPI